MFDRAKSQYKPKLDPNASPALMAGWRLKFGLRFEGVLILLDNHALREGIVCVQAPDWEIYTRDKVTFPLSDVAEKALEHFADPSTDFLEQHDPLPIPFMEDTPEVRKKTKRVYIIYRCIQRLGPAPGCRACLAYTSNHTPECVARHEETHGHASPAPTPRGQGELEELLDETFPPGLDSDSLHLMIP